jgi:tetratricopeptide (TPR) repeat protein
MSPERPPKVFISYSHDSDEHEDRVLDLAEHLVEDGIDVALDRFVHPPPSSWPLWMETEMDAADYIVVVCSRGYLAKVQRKVKRGTGKGIKWESLLSYQQIYDNDSNSAKFIPVLLEGGEYKHIPKPMRGGNHYKPNQSSEYEKLLRHISNQPETPKPEPRPLKRLPPRSRSETKASSAFKPWNIPHQRNDAFTGREQLLAHLRNDLIKKHKQALSGLGGVGKTQIAIEYAYRHKHDYTAVLWTFADTEQSIRGGFAQIASYLNLPEKDATEQAKVTEAVRRWLDENPGWLLVFDNADDPTVIKDFLPQPGQGHFLVTTRAHQFQKIGIFSPREVDVLTQDEARQFLLVRTGKDSALKSAEADELAKELGYLPLALEQAAAYIVENGTNFASYLAGFKKQRQWLLNQQGSVVGNDEKAQQKCTVATTWAVNFTEIEKSTPASADLLRISAFLAPDAIPFELFEKGAHQLPQGLAARLTATANDPLALDELLSPLMRYSLIRRDQEKRTYSIHPLVQEIVREGLPQSDQLIWAVHTTKIVSSVFPDPSFENRPFCDRLLPHALACGRLIERFSLEFEQAALLLNQAGYYLQERAEYQHAERFLQQALNIRLKIAGPKHPSIVVSLNNLAAVMQMEAKYPEAESLFLQSLEISESISGPKHPHTAVILNNLAGLMQAQGKYQQTEPLLLRSLEIREEAFGADHPSTAVGLCNLAYLYYLQGQYDEAEPLFRRALTIQEMTGPEHPDIAFILNNLALLLSAKEQFQEAEQLHKRAMTVLEKALGVGHPDIAVNRDNLGRQYHREGRFSEAEALLREALHIREAALGPNHPATATSLNNLAELCLSQNNTVEAESLLKRALAIREKYLGPEHSETATTLHNLAGVYRAENRLQEAESLYRRALVVFTNSFGQEHPSTSIVREDLIAFYQEQGRHTEALAIAQKRGN